MVTSSSSIVEKNVLLLEDPLVWLRLVRHLLSTLSGPAAHSSFILGSYPFRYPNLPLKYLRKFSDATSHITRTFEIVGLRTNKCLRTPSVVYGQQCSRLRSGAASNYLRVYSVSSTDVFNSRIERRRDLRCITFRFIFSGQWVKRSWSVWVSQCRFFGHWQGIAKSGLK